MIISNLISKKITSVLKSNNYIESSYCTSYQYCLEYLFDILMFNSSILIIGAILHKFLMSALYLIIMIPIRKFAGGIHANSRKICSILSYFTFFSALGGAYIYCHFYALSSIPVFLKCMLLISYFITAFIIIHLSPIISSSEKLSKAKMQKHRHFTIISIIIISAVFIFLIISNQQNYYAIIYVCVIINTFSMLLSKLLSGSERNDSKHCNLR